MTVIYLMSQFAGVGFIQLTTLCSWIIVEIITLKIIMISYETEELMNQLNNATLEASKRLSDAGIVLETEVVWATDGLDWVLMSRDRCGSWMQGIPAPSMAEVWMELPATIPDRGLYAPMKLRKAGDGKTWGSYFRDGSQIIDSIKADINPTDALINLLIWVRKEASHDRN